MKCAILASSLTLLLSGTATAFTVSPSPKTVSFPQRAQQHVHRLEPLFMGRAAAVRAATKGKTDAKKAKVNAYYGKKIIMAVKQGGSADPVANRQLGDLIKAAKNNSVPMDNINRAIKRATEKDAGDFSESKFEAYGHGGASFVINVLSDNANRSTADVRSAVNKLKGKMAEQGSVLFMYDLKGKIEVASAVDEDELLEAVIEAGVDDYELLEGDEEGTSIIYTDPKETSAMFDAVKAMGKDEGAKMSLAHVTKAPVECTEEDFDKNMAIIDALEELDDVDSVEHNMSN
jgi:YebC/PmpR family DNA-binding regulatory protein